MLIQRELRQNLKGFIINTLICTALSLYLVALIPSMGADLQEMLDMKLPKQLQLAFGMSGVNMQNPMSAYSIMFGYLYLTFGIYAATIFGRIVSKEYAEKTAEFLYSLPATRMQIIVSKLGVAMGYLTVSVLVTFVATLIGFATLIKDPVRLAPLLWMTVAEWLGAMFLGALAFLLSAYYVKSRMAVGIVLGAYLLQVVLSLNQNLDALKVISPFDWFKGNQIVSSESLPLGYTLLAIALTGVCGFIGFRRFHRADVLV